MHICFPYLVLEQQNFKIIQCTVRSRLRQKPSVGIGFRFCRQEIDTPCRLDTSKGWNILCRYEVEPSGWSLYDKAVISKLFSGAHVISRVIYRRRPDGDPLVFAAQSRFTKPVATKIPRVLRQNCDKRRISCARCCAFGQASPPGLTPNRPFPRLN